MSYSRPTGKIDNFGREIYTGDLLVCLSDPATSRGMVYVVLGHKSRILMTAGLNISVTVLISPRLGLDFLYKNRFRRSVRDFTVEEGHERCYNSTWTGILRPYNCMIVNENLGMLHRSGGWQRILESETSVLQQLENYDESKAVV